MSLGTDTRDRQLAQRKQIVALSGPSSSLVSKTPGRNAVEFSRWKTVDPSFFLLYTQPPGGIVKDKARQERAPK